MNYTHQTKTGYGISFSLEHGVIREYKEIQVSGSYTLHIPGTERWVIPEIIVSRDMTVDFEEKPMR